MSSTSDNASSFLTLTSLMRLRPAEYSAPVIQGTFYAQNAAITNENNDLCTSLKDSLDRHFVLLRATCLYVRQPNIPTVLQLLRMGEFARGSYDADILKPILCVVLVAALAMFFASLSSERNLAAPTCLSLEGALAARLADAYAAYAPLLVFYESYGEYLFDGTEVTAPSNLSGCCETFPIALAQLHVELVAADGLPDAGELNALLLELRGDADAFCGVYRPALETIDSWGEADLVYLQEASEARLFARIYELNERLERLFTTAFDGIAEEDARWHFAVAFTVRTLASRGRIGRIEEDLTGIFYGRVDASAPPFPVAAHVKDAMAGLIALVGRDISPEESQRAARWVNEILAAFVPN